MRNFKRALCILFVMAVLSTTLFTSAFAQETQVGAVAGVSYGQTFSLNQPVTVTWNAIARYSKTFKVELYDMKAKKTVSKITIAGASLTYDASFFTASKTYRVSVSALGTSGKSIKSASDYFHIGKPVVNPPHAPNEPLTITGVAAVMAVEGVQMTAAPEQSAPQLDDAFGSVAAIIKSDNPYFSSSNANGASSLWFNRALNSQFDAYVSSVLSNSYYSSHFRYDYAFEATIFNLVNQYRIEMGREPLIWSDNLAKLARLRVTAGSDAGMTHDMAEVGGFPLSSATNCGWKQKTIFGENIVGKASTAAVDWPSRASELVTMWKNSPGHNENMLDERYHYGAIAIVVGDNSFGRGMTGAWALELFAG